MAEKLEIAGLSIEWVLRQWKQIAEANPGELCWTEVDCCRHCYGVEHKYQWIELEFRQAFDSALAHQCGKMCERRGCINKMPDGSGGIGYDPRKPPVSDCPVCAGRGTERVRIADTRHVKGSARRLYAGVKQTKDGIEIKMRDQDAALQNISKYFGMVIDRKEISGPGGKPIKLDLKKVDMRDLSDEQLIKVIQDELETVVE
jgi:phage terminase small subunit